MGRRTLDEAARERYSKHVKTILQVGDRATASWSLRLIRMVKVAEEGVDYESNWATLTFEAKCTNGD